VNGTGSKSGRGVKISKIFSKQAGIYCKNI
jgi:hypothetical protein